MLRFIAVLIAASLYALTVQAQQAPAAQDGGRAFVERAASTALTGIRLGKLALARSSNVDARNLARRMVDDFDGIYKGLADQAKHLNLEIPKDLSPAAVGRVQQLAGLSGDAFNRAFSAHAVRLHSEMLALFRSQAAEGPDALKQFAADRVPTLRRSLQMADAAARRQAPAGQATGQQVPSGPPQAPPSVAERERPLPDRPAVFLPYPVLQ